MKLFASLCVAASLSVTSLYAAVPVTTDLVEDIGYQVSNAYPQGITNATGTAYCYPPIPAFGLNDNSRGGRINLKFSVELPSGITSATQYEVKSASVVVWHTTDTANLAWDPVTSPLELHALGFNSEFTEAAWFGSADWWTSYSAPKFSRTNPYGRDFTTDAPMAVTTTAWATGIHPDYPFAQDAEPSPFPITFNLNVTDPKIQQELKDDLASGFSSWTISNNILVQGQGGNISYPKVYLRGGAPGAFTYPAAPIAIPTLKIEVEGPAAASDWELFN